MLNFEFAIVCFVEHSGYFMCMKFAPWRISIVLYVLGFILIVFYTFREAIYRVGQDTPKATSNY